MNALVLFQSQKMRPKNIEGKMIVGARRLRDAPNVLLVLLFIFGKFQFSAIVTKVMVQQIEIKLQLIYIHWRALNCTWK